jgi:hypothetical protein
MMPLLIHALAPFLFFLQASTPLAFEEVVPVDNTTKEDLYKRAKYWAVDLFNNPNKVIQLDDPSEGVLVIKAQFPYNQSWSYASESSRGIITYTLKIMSREGRYKYTFSDFVHTSYGSASFLYHGELLTTAAECPNPMKGNKSYSQKVWDDLKLQSKQYATGIASSLSSSMSQPLESEKEDW